MANRSSQTSGRIEVQLPFAAFRESAKSVSTYFF